MAPKSILKVKNAPSGTILSTVTPSVEERNRELAIHHANLIHDQKDAQNEVFKSMMVLIDLPTHSSATAESPNKGDTSSLAQHMQLFTPTDFDELIQERHANGKCGYPLCPRPYKQQSTTAKFRILGKATDMKIVSKESLENWCSADCARRAMYMRVQLSDEPAWLRASATEIKIMPEQGQTLALRPKPPPTNITDESILSDSLQQAHLEERDDMSPANRDQLMRKDILERSTTRPAAAPDVDTSTSDFVEGYHAAISSARKDSLATDEDADEDGDEDNDWDL